MLKQADTFLHRIISSKNKLEGRLKLKKKALLVATNDAELPGISVVIPVIEKDLPLLAITIKHLKKYCQNPIKTIYIVSPDSLTIKEFCIMEDLVWVNEKVIAPVEKELIYDKIQNNLVNWIYQQFLKLSIDKIVEDAYCLILDCDTILLTKQYFVTHTKMILKSSDEYHFLYQKTNKAILPSLKWHSHSFIAHHQIIKIDILRELKQAVELYNKSDFFKVALEQCSLNFIKFSEYELYGSYVSTFYPNDVQIVYWNHKNLKAKDFKHFFRKPPNHFLTASFHNYNYDLFTKEWYSKC
ncbi:MAG: DUF6492 family protein [Flavobacterium sp.]|nr:DUF6492 family protein [Flavobacterium sp.]